MVSCRKSFANIKKQHNSAQKIQTALKQWHIKRQTIHQINSELNSLKQNWETNTQQKFIKNYSTFTEHNHMVLYIPMEHDLVCKIVHTTYNIFCKLIICAPVNKILNFFLFFFYFLMTQTKTTESHKY